MKGRISSFSVLLVMAVMAFVGIVTLPMLNIQYKPSQTHRTIGVSFSYPGASPEIVEADVTAVIEGLMAGLTGNTGTSSTSYKGGGEVYANFDKKTDMAQVRLELASAIRNIYSEFPAGVSYPVISHDARGKVSGTSMSYLLKGNLPSHMIEKYAKEHMVPELAVLEGVETVNLHGGSPYHWVITFDADKAASVDVTAMDICSAVSNVFSEYLAGLSVIEDEVIAVRLSSDVSDFGAIPVKNSHGRIIYLSDIADWSYEESLPLSYYRVNGLNTVTMSVGIAGDVNLLNTASLIRARMASLAESFPDEITADIAYDPSEYVSGELKRIYFRTGLCILILLLFVFLVNRSWRYMLIITISLAVNILISLAVYVFAGISIHIYTLAGITVSLGIIIDTSIVMIDHYAHFRNLRVFPSLVAAVGTTVAALLMVLLLPEEEKVNLVDFIFVIALNLCISLLVSWLFIPALMDYIPVYPKGRSFSVARNRRRLAAGCLYERYINWGVSHRWVYILVFIVAFGIPICLLPSSSEMDKIEDKNIFQKVISEVVSWPFYENNRQRIDKIAGSSFGAFHRALGRSDFYREPEQKILYIKAGMLEGCTVHQLNEVIKAMENYLAGFDEIKVFVTDISSYSDATIAVEFKPEYEDTYFPSYIKSLVTSMAVNFGGANWTVYGVDDNSFNNNVVSSHKTNRITLRGYNYPELRRYAEILVEHISDNKRVSGTEIWGAGWAGRPNTEFVMMYDFEKMAVAGVNPYQYYSSLSSRIYEGVVTAVETEGEMTDVVVRSSDVDEYDYWHILHSPVAADGISVPLKDFGNIEKQRSEVSISRSFQSYELNVCFDFIGSYELSRRMMDNAVEYMNDNVLPVGYKAFNPIGGRWNENKHKYAWLIFLIIAVIFVMLSITFESVRQPFAVIFMIPISFIGLFLTFGLSDLSFDQGGFAAFVSLCGIVVNAGIYIVLMYKDIRMRRPRVSGAAAYVRAFGRKIHPIMLTVISTILGLVPFLTDGPEEVFWFDFAAGTMGGMLFSLIALLVYLPVFVITHPRK